MLKLGVLVSGGGTNLQAIMDAIDSGVITNAEVGLVISNNPGAYALKRAESRGIPAKCISPKKFENREEFHKALLQELQENKVELVVLAGFLVAIPPMIVEAYPNRIINIHPSLFLFYDRVSISSRHIVFSSDNYRQQKAYIRLLPQVYSKSDRPHQNIPLLQLTALFPPKG